MHYTLSKRVLFAATAMSAVLAAPAYAQGTAGEPTAAPAGADDADAIVVTARRVEENVQDVPISITVFNQQQLLDRNITSTTDLATYTPGLALNGRYGPDKASFIIRGFSQELNTQPTVGVYFADAVAPRLQSNIGGGNGAGPGSMFDLQNVQVLKGPQGTLFGRNTTGGAILLVPQRPTDRVEGYVEGTYGNHDQKRVQAVLNLPVGNAFKVRFGIDRNKRDGWQNNRTDIGPDKFTDINYTALRLSILSEITPDLENLTIGSYVRSSTNGTVPKMVYYNRYFDNPVPTNPLRTSSGATGLAALLGPGVRQQVLRQQAAGYGYYDVENNAPNPFVNSTTWQIINTTTWTASDTLTVKNIVSYGEAREKYSFSLDGDNTTFPFVITYPGPTGRTQGSQSTMSEEFQLQGRTTNDFLTWQAGYYMEISEPIGSQEQYTQVAANCTDVYTFRCTTLSPAVSSVSVARNNYTYHNYGVYAQGTINITDQLGLTLGARNTWDYVKEEADNVRIVPSAAGALSFSCSRVYAANGRPVVGTAALLTNAQCRRTFETKSNKPTWLIDLDFKPTQDLLIYAKYARGYRGGGINEANLGAETWQPEKVDDYEVGVKGSFRGTVSGTFSLGGYWNDFSNQQTTVTIPQCTPVGNPACISPAPTGINGIQNIGKSRMRGVEADGSVSYGPVRLDFGYSYLQAKVISASTPICSNASFVCSQASFLGAGNTLPFSPKNRVTLTGTFTVPMDEAMGRLSASATYVHTSKQISSYSNAVAFAQGAIPYDAGIAPSTDLLNLNLNWRGVAGSPVDLALFATNVTKEKYWVAIVNGLSSLGGEAVIPGEPRMYGARIRVNFGR